MYVMYNCMLATPTLLPQFFHAYLPNGQPRVTVSSLTAKASSSPGNTMSPNPSIAYLREG